MAKNSKEYHKAWYQAHREEQKAKKRAYYQSYKKEEKARVKAWQESHREDVKAYKKDWRESHNATIKAYYKRDVNSSGIPKVNIRTQSRRYLSKHGKKIPGYEIHHCFTYDDPTKFIYCSKDTHILIHIYLREHNIDSDSDHYEQIKHLLDDSVRLYGLKEDGNDTNK